jgi:hypothetical protein
MKKFSIPIVLLAALSQAALSQNVAAANIVPQFNLSGTWNLGGSDKAIIFQAGTAQITWVEASPQGLLYYIGRYITPNKVEGVGHSIIRATNCSTDFLVTITASDNNSLAFSGTALYSSCGYTKGQIITDSATRIN